MGSLSAGDIVAKNYRIDRSIGQGAFGEVYLATHLKLNGKRAIKVLLRNDIGVGSSDYEEYRNRFRQESQLMEILKHPNIIQVFDFQEENNTLFLIMEYAAGGNLKEKLDRYRTEDKVFSVEETIKIGLDISRGLSALHRLDVVHRDLKPSNILFDIDGNAKVADLGLAQIPGGASMRSTLSVSKAHPGTPAYMSPEQEGTGGYLGPSSDIYSLGLILFELLTGRNYKNIKPGSRLSNFIPASPEWLDGLLQKMLATNPKERLWNGDEVVTELQNGMNGVPQPSEVEIQQESESQKTEQVLFETPDLKNSAPFWKKRAGIFIPIGILVFIGAIILSQLGNTNKAASTQNGLIASSNLTSTSARLSATRQSDSNQTPIQIQIPLLTPDPNNCNLLKFVADVTIPDGSYIKPGTPFTKTWRIINSGHCKWEKDYSLVYSEGDRMGGNSITYFGREVEPGQTIDLSLSLTAPTAPGIYKGYWLMKDNKNQIIKTTSDTYVKVFVEITTEKK